MNKRKPAYIRNWILTATLLITIVVIAGCSQPKSDPQATKPALAVTEQPGPERTSDTGLVDSASPEPVITPEPMNKQEPVLLQGELEDTEAWIALVRELEHRTLDIMSVAEHRARNEAAPTFAQLKEALLTYHTGATMALWEHMYEEEPGWIYEPRGLIHAEQHVLLNSSFSVKLTSDTQAEVEFKTYGDSQYPLAERVKLTLVKGSDDGWRMHEMSTEALENGFSRAEAEEILAFELEGAVYESEDETYVYFIRKGHSNESGQPVFVKKEGYWDVLH